MREEFKVTTKNLFSGSGELEELLRSHDWSQTPLGAVETWSDELKATVPILLIELDRAKRAEKLLSNGHLPQDEATSAALEQANQLNAFRVRLADALRPLVDASEIQETAACVLGEALGATRVVYLEVVSNGKEVIVHRNYTNGVAQLNGRYRLEDYDRNLSADHQDGRTQVVTDIPNSSTYTDDQKARYREVDIAAHIDVPLIKNHQFVALLAVHQSTARQWTETEIKQVEETAEWTWAAVERARAEAALRESEEKYRSLFTVIDEGFCHIEVLYDEHGYPVDHRILDANPAFERHTGLVQPQGKLASEFMPELEPAWNNLYARVATTGKSEQIEQYSPAFDRWFEVKVSCVGERSLRTADKGGSLHQVAVILQNITERKQSELQLQASHDTFRHLVDNSPFGVYVVDADFRIAQASAGARKAFKNVRPLMGRDFGEVMRTLWPESFASEAVTRFRHTLKTGEPYRAPSLIERRIDVDEVESYDWEIERITLPDGRFGVVCHFYDMTERQRYEAELQASEARFRNMADNAPIMIWVTNSTGYCTYLSQSWYDYSGQTEETGLGFGWLNATHPDDRATAEAIFLVANERQEAFQIEYRLRRHDGQYRTCIDAAKPWFGADGTFKGYIGSVIDIEDRIQAEVALRESEERYRTLFESIDQGFCLLEVLFDANDKAIDYRYLEVNEAFEQQSGLTDAVGKTILELVPNLEPQWASCYEQVVKRREAVRFEADVPSMNRFFDIYAFPSGAPGQNLVAVLFTDIAEHKRREAKLAFLAEIQDDCARLTTAEAIMQTIGAKIGAYLNLSICAFIDIDVVHDQATIAYSWHRADVLKLAGTYCISQFVNETFYLAAQAGEVIVVSDTNTDARTDAESCAAVGVQAFIHVPFLENGQWKFLFNVYDSRPRHWREDEIELFSELANRIFPRLERARAEDALRQSEQRYRTLFESIDAGFCTIEVLVDDSGKAFDYRFLKVNPAFVQQTGLEDAVGRTVRELVPQHEEFWFEVYGDIARTGQAQRFEHPAVALGKFYDVYAFRINDAATAEVAVLFNDISDRKQTEAIITTDLANTRLLRDLSARMISEDNIQVLYDEIVAAAISLTQADAGCVQILDDTTQDLVLLAAQGFDDNIIHCCYRVSASYKTSCGVALATGTRVFVGFDVPADDDSNGSLQVLADAGFVCAQSTPLISRSGKLIGMVSTHWRRQYQPSDRELRFLDLLARQAADLIDRRQTEAALQESEELKQSILDSSKDCIKVLALDTRIVYINSGGLRLLEINNPKFVLNTCWLDFWQGEAYEDAKAAIATAKAGKTGQFQGHLPTHKGTPRWWDVLITPVRNSAGQVTQLLAVSRDITKQKQAEAERERLLAQEQAAREQAETANRIKDEFLAVLSHELRSPLNPILGWTQLLQSGHFDEIRRIEALKTIERNAKLQAQLIEDLLDISRIMQGKFLLTVAPVNLPSVISAAIETVRLAAEVKQIQLRIDLEASVSSISGDAARLQQVVWNLLTNAIKFTPQAGQVTVELRQLDQLAQIRVIDTGKGINPEFLPHVFEYFRQEDGSTTRKFGGLGLGLAIVRQIVEMHGGTVEAESLGEDQGATFIVQLPIIQQTTPASRETFNHFIKEKASLVNVQILLVDDERDSREFQAFLLEQHGAKVTAVASGLEALQALDHFQPDVLVSDIGMPEMDGYMLLQHIRSRSPEQGGNLRAIALTAYAAEIDHQRALQVGFQGHITKPVQPEALVKALASLLEQF